MVITELEKVFMDTLKVLVDDTTEKQKFKALLHFTNEVSKKVEELEHRFEEHERGDNR